MPRPRPSAAASASAPPTAAGQTAPATTRTGRVSADPTAGGAPVALPARFGETVRRLRAAAGMGQEEFADRTGLHRTGLSLVERGLSDPKLSTVARIAGELGMTASALLRETERDGQ